MERETENPFAAVIRIMRGNTPQGVFAERLGIKQAKYSHYENHRREPSLDELCRIARALDTTPNVLLGFEPPPLRASPLLGHPLRGQPAAGGYSSPREINIRDIKNNSAPVVLGDGNNVNVKVPPPVVIIINNHQEERQEEVMGSAVAIGANARATSRTTNYQLPTTNTPGEMPACSKCPHLKKLKKLEALMSK